MGVVIRTAKDVREEVARIRRHFGEKTDLSVRAEGGKVGLSNGKGRDLSPLMGAKECLRWLAGYEEGYEAARRA